MIICIAHYQMFLNGCQCTSLLAYLRTFPFIELPVDVNVGRVCRGSEALVLVFAITEDSAINHLVLFFNAGFLPSIFLGQSPVRMQNAWSLFTEHVIVSALKDGGYCKKVDVFTFHERRDIHGTNLSLPLNRTAQNVWNIRLMRHFMSMNFLWDVSRTKADEKPP